MLYLLVLSDTLNMEQRIPGKEGTNRGLKGVRSLMQLANDADASTFLLSLPTMLCIYLRSGKLQGSTAAQSGKLKGVIGS